MFTHNFMKTAAYNEFETERLKYSNFGQVFVKKSSDINSIIENNKEAILLGKTHLNKNEAWNGLKWKAETPEKYISVKESAIVPGSRKITEYGETFMRLTIQPSFATGNFVLVKEEIHIYENEKKILFLGREVDIDEARKYLKEIEESMLLEKPALFHVEHALKGLDDNNPIATWQMVRMSDSQDDAEKKRINDIVHGSNGLKIYLQTIKQLNTQKNVLQNDV